LSAVANAPASAIAANRLVGSKGLHLLAMLD
jgi:hypothetical protein